MALYQRGFLAAFLDPEISHQMVPLVLLLVWANFVLELFSLLFPSLSLPGNL